MKKGFVVLAVVTFLTPFAIAPTHAEIDQPYIKYPPGIRCTMDNNGLESGACEGSHTQDSGTSYLIAGAGAFCQPPVPPTGDIAATMMVIGINCRFPFYEEGFAGLDGMFDQYGNLIDAVSAHVKGQSVGLEVVGWQKENCRGDVSVFNGPEIPC